MSAAPGRPKQARAAGRSPEARTIALQAQRHLYREVRHAHIPTIFRCVGRCIATRAALCVALGCVLSPSGAEEDAVVAGYGRIDGRYCTAGARLALDDGRRFEVDTQLATGTTVEVRAAATGATLCGRAPRLTGVITAAPARPAIELALHARDWPRHAEDVAALSRSFPAARLRLRVLAVDVQQAHAAVLHIASQLLQQRPDLMARTTITPVPPDAAVRDAPRGWRVVFDASEETGSVHADSADDVARLLAAVR